MLIMWICLWTRFVFRCVWEINGVARADLWGVSGARARQHHHAQHLSPTDISAFHLIFTSQTKRASTTASYLYILLVWITVRTFAPRDWSVFMENGEMGSRVSAADYGDFQRIVDRSGRAHIPTAFHVRNINNSIALHEIITHSYTNTRKTRSFPNHYT